MNKNKDDVIGLVIIIGSCIVTLLLACGAAKLAYLIN